MFSTNLDNVLSQSLERLTRLEKKWRKDKVNDVGGGYYMTMPVYRQFSPYTGTFVTHFMAVPRALTIKKIIYSTYTVAPNNAGNHWTVELAAGGVTLLTAQTLEADTASTWTRHEYTTFSADTVAITDTYFFVTATKVGFPGAVYIGNPMLLFI